MNEHMQRTISEALDRRARDLDGHTLSRLRQARACAVAQATPAHSHRPLLWAGGLGLAATALLAVLLLPQTPPPAPAATDDLIEVATLDVELEVIEDLAFYEWLSVQRLDETSDGGPA